MNLKKTTFALLTLTSINTMLGSMMAYADESSIIEQSTAEQNTVTAIVMIQMQDEQQSLASTKRDQFHLFDPKSSKAPALIEKHQEIIQLEQQRQSFTMQHFPKKPMRESEERAFMDNLSQYTTFMERDTSKRMSTLVEEKINAFNEDSKRSMQQRFANSSVINNMKKSISAMGGSVSGLQANSNTITVTIPKSELDSLRLLPNVKELILEPTLQLELDRSMKSAGFPAFWAKGIDGAPLDIGISDGGIQPDHPALQNADIEVMPGHEAPSSHGTHVAGIAASRDTRFRGGAPGASLMSAPFGFRGVNWLMTKSGDTADVVNSSWGASSNIDTDDYTRYDQQFDRLVFNENTLMVKSAGNKGWSETNNTITRPGTAYNIVTVANMNDNNTLTRYDDVRRRSSSVGPTPADRRKPDVSAPGTRILSTNYLWESGDIFVSKSGTSMAAPHVSAALTLIADSGLAGRTMSQKALLIQTADAWTSRDTEDSSDDGPVSGSHWDRSYGWGYIDIKELAFHTQDVFSGTVGAANNTAQDDDYKLYAGQLFTHEKATLVWQRRFDAAGNVLPLTDLNLELYDGSDNNLAAVDDKHNDNVHQVSSSWDMDTAVIKVYNASQVAGASSEPYALATEEFFKEVSPPALTIHTISSGSLEDGENTISIHIKNEGGLTAHNVTLSVTTPNTTIFTEPQYATIQAIKANSDAVITFPIDSSEALVNSEFDITTESDSYGETYIHNVTLTVR